MTKLEFMTQLERALKKHGAADCEDIMEEYEQHFAFKLADGYSEEEISAKLGAPEELAQQFAPAAQKKPGAGRFFTVFGCAGSICSTAFLWCCFFPGASLWHRWS